MNEVNIYNTIQPIILWYQEDFYINTVTGIDKDIEKYTETEMDAGMDILTSLSFIVYFSQV